MIHFCGAPGEIVYFNPAYSCVSLWDSDFTYQKFTDYDASNKNVLLKYPYFGRLPCIVDGSRPKNIFYIEIATAWIFTLALSIDEL